MLCYRWLKKLFIEKSSKIYVYNKHFVLVNEGIYNEIVK